MSEPERKVNNLVSGAIRDVGGYRIYTDIFRLGEIVLEVGVGVSPGLAVYLGVGTGHPGKADVARLDGPDIAIAGEDYARDLVVLLRHAASFIEERVVSAAVDRVIVQGRPKV